MRVKGNEQTGTWKWSSYRATAGLVSAREFLATDWVLGHFGKNLAQAQKRYREFVREGLQNRPWEALRGQIYLGSEAFIEGTRRGIENSKRSHARKSEQFGRRWRGS
jgi:hypothetical protein